MKKLYFLLLLVTGTLHCQVYIPDANFKAKLIALGIDTNTDGEIDQPEAEAVSVLNISNSNIADLTGIEAFLNLSSIDFSNNNIGFAVFFDYLYLTEVNASNNPLTVLEFPGVAPLIQISFSNTLVTGIDLSGRTELVGITAGNTPLTWINVTGCTSLGFIQIANAPLTSIDLSTCSSLYNVYLYNNQLELVVLPENGVLQILNVTGNQLETLNMTAQPQLELLDCQLNNLTAIDLSNSVSLEWLSAGGNDLTTIDVSNSPVLNNLHLAQNPNLTTVFMKNGALEASFNFSDNPNLVYICADEEQITDVAASAGSDVVVNSFCTFTPGGDHNTISGTVTYDGNNNGCDASDSVNEFIKMGISGSAGNNAAFTSEAGTYNFDVQNGSFTVSPLIENPSYFTVSPLSASIIFPSVDNSVFTQNFCIAPNGSHFDAEIVIVPIFPAQPGFNALYEIVYRNIGTETLNGTFSFSYPEAVLDFIIASDAPAVIGDGTLTWNYDALLPFESRSISVMLNVNSPLDTPPVAIDDILNFSAAVLLNTATDETPANNSFSYDETVTGSYDPNDKTCIQGNVVSTDEIGDYLHYVINFENTGTAPAQNIVVRDVINTAQFDISSLQLISASHPVIARVQGNMAEFILQNIQLDSGGHGNILMKIRTLGNLTAGTTVSNRADIYFDYNAPVITEFAHTQFQNLKVDDIVDNSIAVYPNPATTAIQVAAKSIITTLQLFDIQGRLLQTLLNDKTTATLNIAAYQSGIYVLKITSDAGVKIQKIIKD